MEDAAVLAFTREELEPYKDSNPELVDLEVTHINFKKCTMGG